uniref:Uncharacterized protein n=1 Tax=Cacopsylla melanoneura TaxID=428564 RepID=A0A8D8LSN8_9HEMI
MHVYPVSRWLYYKCSTRVIKFGFYIYWFLDNVDSIQYSFPLFKCRVFAFNGVFYLEGTNYRTGRDRYTYMKGFQYSNRYLTYKYLPTIPIPMNKYCYSNSYWY